MPVTYKSYLSSRQSPEMATRLYYLQFLSYITHRSSLKLPTQMQDCMELQHTDLTRGPYNCHSVQLNYPLSSSNMLTDLFFY